MSTQTKQLKTYIEILCTAPSEVSISEFIQRTAPHAAPRCSCGAAHNLTEVRATEHSTYWLCPVCLADEETE